MYSSYDESDRFYDEVEPYDDGVLRYTYYSVDLKTKHKYQYEELETLDETDEDSDYYYYTTVYDDEMDGKHYELWETYTFEGRTIRHKLIKRIQRLNATDEYLKQAIEGYASVFIKDKKMRDTNSNVGGVILEYLRLSGVSRTELCGQMKVTQAVMSKWIGFPSIPYERAYEICGILKIPHNVMLSALSIDFFEQLSKEWRDYDQENKKGISSKERKGKTTAQGEFVEETGDKTNCSN